MARDAFEAAEFLLAERLELGHVSREDVAGFAAAECVRKDVLMQLLFPEIGVEVAPDDFEMQEAVALAAHAQLHAVTPGDGQQKGH